MGVAASERRLDLDWVRITAFGLLILYHCAMFYVPWDWHVKSPHVAPALDPIMRLTNPWRLPLLFLVSGVATRFMADKMSASGLLKRRTARLLPPLIFGMVVIVPPQTFMQVAVSLHHHLGFAQFYGRYLTATGHWVDPSSGPIATPTWNHLWFVAYLFVYTVALTAVLALGRGVLAWVEGMGARLLQHPAVILLAPLAGAVSTRVVLAPLFPDTHALLGDWAVHAESVLPFLFGFLFAKAEAVWTAILRARWAGLLIGAAGYAVLVWIVTAYTDQNPPPVLYPLLRAAYGLEQWGWIIALLGFARRYLCHVQDTPLRRYLTDAIFPFYMIHQTIVVVLAPNLVRLGLPQGVEAALLVAVTTGGCFATYEVVKRVGWLRPLFGLARRPAQRLTSANRSILPKAPRQASSITSLR